MTGAVPDASGRKRSLTSLKVDLIKFMFVGLMVLNTSCNMLKMIIGTMTFKYTIFGN